MEKTKTKINEIEDFADVNSNIKLFGYNPATNKTGRVSIAAVQNKIPYCGVRFAKANSSPVGEPIGDLQMLAQLPSILGLGGYLVKNDHSRQKLASDTHFKLESGGTAKLDGSMGHYNWGWNIPYYYATWEDDTYEYEAISTAPMSGRWNYRIPVASTACAGASALDRTNNILVNYCNRTAQYRGGTNDNSLDSAWNTMLGKPVVNVAENLMQQYAEKNGDRWGSTMFPMVFMIGALCRIIFHNRNIQAAYNATLTSDGLHQGGLGMGVDDVSSSFGNQYATVDIDALADKGDAIGVFSVDCKDSAGTTKLTIKNIPCFYGLKNFYHYIAEMEHGCNMVYNSDYTVTMYAQQKWTKDAVVTDTVKGMRQIGTAPAVTAANWYFIKRMNLQRMLLFPTELGGSEITYYGDGFYHAYLTSGLRGLLAFGTANLGGIAGNGYLSGFNAPSVAWASGGGALCEAAEDWDTEPFWEA